MADAGARLVQWDDQRQEQHRQQEQGQQQQHQQGGGGAGLVMGEVTAEEAEYLMHAALAGGNTVGGGTTDDAPRPRGPLKTLAEHRHLAEREVDRWMAYKISPYEKHTIKPLQWWAEQGRPQEFPYMSALARRLLFIPASSAGLERVFSQSGLMLSDEHAGGLDGAQVPPRRRPRLPDAARVG